MTEYLEPGATSTAPTRRYPILETEFQGSAARERAVSLYYAVRDQVRYNPFLDFSNAEVFKASSVLAAEQGFCVGKAALLAPAPVRRASPRAWALPTSGTT